MSERIKKVNELIKQEVNAILLKEVDFGNAIVTITDVDTSSGLKHAKIKIIIYPERLTEEVFQILEKNIYDVQQVLNKRLKMKYVPKIKFEIDKIEVEAQKLEKTLKRIDK
ncbi:MAG: ribosome-binding factor A [bacterium]